jgi:hypothetical protein
MYIGTTDCLVNVLIDKPKFIVSSYIGLMKGAIVLIVEQERIFYILNMIDRREILLIDKPKFIDGSYIRLMKGAIVLNVQRDRI